MKTDPFVNPDSEFRCRLYRKSELARLYFPHSTPRSAIRQLLRWINRCRPLRAALDAAGCNRYRQSYLSHEVRLIVQHLGEP